MSIKNIIVKLILLLYLIIILTVPGALAQELTMTQNLIMLLVIVSISLIGLAIFKFKGNVKNMVFHYWRAFIEYRNKPIN